MNYHSLGRGRSRRWASESAVWGAALCVFTLVVGCSSDDDTVTNTGGSGGKGGSAGSSAGSSTGGHAGSSTAGAGGSVAGSSGSLGVGEAGAGEAGANEAGSGGSGGSAAGSGGSGGSVAGSGGSGGSVAGSGGSGGAIGGSGGSGGSVAGSGGSGGAIGGSGGSGGAIGGSGGSGGSGGAAPVPVGVAITGGDLTNTMLDGQNADPAYTLWDTCPDSQVMVGLNWVAYGDFISGTQAVCGTLTVTNTTQVNLSVSEGDTLFARGGDAPATTGSSICPKDNVVVGFSGRYNDRLRIMTLTCAPVVPVFQDGVVQPGVDLDSKVALPSFGPEDKPNDVDFAFSGCPDGQIARGTSVLVGEFGDKGWVESFTLMCGTPNLTFANGTPCTQPNECDSRSCDTTCKAFTCDAPAGCTCVPFGGKNYAFCPQTDDNATAEGVCETKAMHLAWVKDDATAGWLRSAANANAVTADAFIGFDDLTTHGTFEWTPNGGAATFTNWGGGYYGLEPNCLDPGCDAIENCSVVRSDGAWNNIDCALMSPFICSN